MKTAFSSLVLAGLALAAPFGSAAEAAVITSFNSNFEEDAAALPPQLDYHNLTQWNVIAGSIDLIKDGDYGVHCKSGVGTCVDMDGTNFIGAGYHAGTIETKDSFAPGKYLVKFEISGNQGRDGRVDTLNFSFGGTSLDFVRNLTDPFETIVLTVVLGAQSTLRFAADGGDDFGIILDNVSVGSVSAVPLPAAMPLFATALGGMGWLGWRRRRAAV